MNDIKKIFVVVEDDADMRLVIRVTLERDPRLELVGEAASAADALDVLDDIDPGLIILDHSIDGDVMGLDAAPLLKERAPNAKILLFTAYDLSREAKREPAVDAFLRKDEIQRLLPTALRLLELSDAA